MAWFTEQIFADFLNRWGDHKVVSQALMEILDDNAVMHFGTQIDNGKESIIRHLEEIAVAISSDMGFRAKPVIIVEDDLQNKLSLKAVALHSKLEDYVSWFFMLKGNANFKIESITATQGIGYSYYFDIYQEGNYNYDDLS